MRLTAASHTALAVPPVPSPCQVVELLQLRNPRAFLFCFLCLPWLLLGSLFSLGICHSLSTDLQPRSVGLWWAPALLCWQTDGVRALVLHDPILPVTEMCCPCLGQWEPEPGPSEGRLRPWHTTKGLSPSSGHCTINCSWRLRACRKKKKEVNH